MPVNFMLNQKGIIKTLKRCNALASEVEAALREMKKGEAMGEDGIAVEMLLILCDFGITLATSPII